MLSDNISLSRWLPMPFSTGSREAPKKRGGIHRMLTLKIRPRTSFAQSFEIGEVRGQRPADYSRHTLSREVLQRFDVVVGQERGEPVAPFHRQDRQERIELQRPPGFGGGAGWR